MPTTTRTLGPLHLEDLEPHRFEDLVRQLLYDFRDWRSLEATGRAGGDAGFDARGWEVISRDAEPPEDAEDEEPGSVVSADRLWLVQCKREKAIGPTKIERYVGDIPDSEGADIYGIVFAAACNFSKKARDRFRERCREFGFAEAHLWGKGEIEDMLFQPKNDHLLFAYFGVSLQTRKRSLKTEVRARLATKRKAMKVLNQHGEVLIRDAGEDRYPYLDDDRTKPRTERGRWTVMRLSQCDHYGLRIVIERYFAYLDDDGVHWDRDNRENRAIVNRHSNPWSENEDGDGMLGEDKDGETAWAMWQDLPDTNKAWYEMFMTLPYDNIIAIDEEGDEIFSSPHIYTGPWHHDYGAFSPFTWTTLESIGRSGRHVQPSPDTRIKKFPRKKRGQK